MSRVIVALDGMSTYDTLAFLDKVDPRSVWGVKVNDLLVAEGARVIPWLTGRGFKVFADPKLHDIPNTVTNSMSRVAGAGASFVTIHISGGSAMIEAAVKGASVNPDCRVLGVTVLTSLSDEDCRGLWSLNRYEYFFSLVTMKGVSSLGGLVCSASELTNVCRLALQVIVVPGFRPFGEVKGEDQSQVGGFVEFKDATHVVVGRPITQADDPAAVITQINDGFAAIEAEGVKDA